MFVNLVVAIKRRGFHAYQVAQQVGISESKLSRAINGRQELSPEEKQQIGNVLAVSPTWLFKESVNMPSLAYPGAER